jgi:hypothetical protein
MIQSVQSKSKKISTAFAESKRRKTEDNLAWLARASKSVEPDGQAELLLLGGTSPVSFRLRIAQSHARSDLTPSHWSHVAVLGARARSLAATPVHEISLEPSGGFGYAPARNAVQDVTLGDYAKVRAFPNIAWIVLPVPRQEFLDKLAQFRRSRGTFDAIELVVQWLGFVWGTPGATNPLTGGVGIPSAALVEVVSGGCGFELTPGVASRSSCPEAIWQTLRWWRDYYEKDNKPAPRGAWHAEHFLVDEYDA